MPRLLTALLASALATSCACGPEQTTDAGQQPPIDAGSRPPVTPGLFDLAAGWPQGEKVVGAANLDGVLTAASTSQVLARAPSATAWAPQAVPLQGDEVPTSLQRLDQRLVLTVAGSTGGGLLVRTAETDWERLSGTPAGRPWALVRRGTQLFLAASTGFYAASQLEGPWTRRTTATPAFFAQVTRLVAAPSQQRMFASGDPATSHGGLYLSDDGGATWRLGTWAGDVRALAASGAVVLMELTTDGQLKSDNYGNTFKALTVGAPATAFEFAASRAWAGTGTGLLSSTDDGASWAADLNGLPAGTAVRALFFSGSTLVVDTPQGPWGGVLP